MICILSTWPAILAVAINNFTGQIFSDMTFLNSAITVAGIDIGGDRKGCHLVVLRGREVLCTINSNDADFLARRCSDFGAVAVAVDSPCRWSSSDVGRAAEKELAKERIFCFATPSRERAATNTSGFYGWMFNGEQVYRALATTYPLLNDARYSSGRVSIETFPHAITCAMLGRDVASAKRKRRQRRQLLEDSGIDTGALKSIDAIDATLCAFTAGCLLFGQTRAYGNAEGGYIFVPKLSGVA